MVSKAPFRIIPVVCLMTVAACRSDSAGGEDVAAVLEVTDRRVSEEGLSFGSGAGSQYIEIRTNIADWIAEPAGSADGWLTAEPVREPEIPVTGVAVAQKLKITAAGNPDKRQRNAVVRISGKDITLTVNVSQAAADDVLTFDTPVYAAAAGDMLEIPVASNVGFTVSVPEACGWIEVATPPDAANSIRLTIDRNDAPESRSADLEVAADAASRADAEGMRKILTVIQQGAEPAIDIDGADEIAVAWDVPYFTLNVTANVVYRIEFVYENSGLPWIWRSVATRAAAREERFVLSANENMETRRVTICFLSDDASVSPALRREIRVTQQGYALPPEGVFELASSAEHYITCESRTITIGIRTGKEAEAIAVGGAEGWITPAGVPQRVLDALQYRFDVAENPWPLGRRGILTFSAAEGTVEVAVDQDGNLTAGVPVEYDSVSGDMAAGSAERLRDCDRATGAASGSSGWPKEWTLGLKNPRDNVFNRLIYYPADASAGIGDYELLALSEGDGTWHRVVSGSVPDSFYAGPAAAGKGFRIDFPTVANARSLMLRVKSAHGGGSSFGASEIHLACDHTLNIPHSPTLELTTVPATLGCGASAFTVGVEAEVPFRVSINGSPGWIACDASSSLPGLLTFTAAANPGAPRSAAVTLASTAGGVVLNRGFTVVQEGNPSTLEFLSPASGSVELTYSARNFAVELTTDIPQDEITHGDLPVWLSLAEKSVPTDGTVRFLFSAEGNTGGTRSHVVVFSARGLTLALTVGQEANPGLTPSLSLVSPDPAEVSLAGPDPADFAIVLATNMGLADITVGTLPEWLTAGVPAHDGGTVTYTFTAAPNPGAARDAVLTFSAAGVPAVSVTVRQGAAPWPGVRVQPQWAVWYDAMLNSSDVPETIDGDKNSVHTVNAQNIWAYEFRFENNTDLAGFIYYPRDSGSEHGSFRRIGVEAVCRDGTTERFSCEIPESLFSTSQSRRAGWRVDLPAAARLISHLRVIPEEGWQAMYSVAEVEFFAPE